MITVFFEQNVVLFNLVGVFVFVFLLFGGLQNLDFRLELKDKLKKIFIDRNKGTE